MEKTGKVFELTVCNLGCEKNVAKDAVFDCVNEKNIDIIVGKSGNDFIVSRIVGILVSVEVNKRIGTHNNIKARLKLVQQTSATDMSPKLNVTLLKNAFLKREVKLNAIVDDESYMIAEKYYVFGVRPVYNKNGATYYVDLNIYSWDKLMDIVKYSKSYANKRLGDDILKGFMSGYQNAPGCQTSGMRVLIDNETGDSPKDNKNEKTAELAFPVLEQYDETEYNFLLRNANKCGEFFYFENGTLNLGLTRVMKKSNGANEEEVVTEIKELSYASIESLSDENNDDETLTAFYQDVAGRKLSANKPYKPVKLNGNLGTPAPPKKDEPKDWDCVFAPLWSRVLARLFQYDNIVSFGIDNATEEVSVSSYKDVMSNSFNTNVVNKYKPSTPQNSQLRSGNNNGNQAYCKYVPDDKLFKLMDKAKLNVSDNQYRITFDDGQLNLKLGDLVSCSGIGNDGRFVVVDVHSVFEKEDVAAETKIVNRMEVTVIPVYDDCPIPLPADTCPKSPANLQGSSPAKLQGSSPANKLLSNDSPGFTMRKATVTDSEDPYRLNQVLVTYDGDKNSSAEWVKVLTPFASKEKGLSCKLGVNDKVLVCSITKDGVTESFVVGSFYDETNIPPCGQRKFSSIIRSKNGQYIGFEEAKSPGGILASFLPILSTMKSLIPPLYSAVAAMEPKKGHEEETKLALGGIEISDNYGLFTIGASSTSRKVTISSPFGTVGIDAAMGITVSAPNGNVKIVGKNVDIVAGNNLTLKSGANIDSGLLTTRSLTLNGAMSELKTLQDAVSGLFDFPALRFVVELLFKPVAGTLKVHSGRYLMLEAGDNEASLPEGMFHRIFSKRSKTVLDSEGKSEGVDDAIRRMANKIETWAYLLKVYKNTWVQEYMNASEKRASLLKIIMNDYDQIKDNSSFVEISEVKVNDLIDRWIKGEADITKEGVEGELHRRVGGVYRKKVVRAVNSIRESYKKLWNDDDDFGKNLFTGADNNNAINNAYNKAKGIRKPMTDNDKLFKITDKSVLINTLFINSAEMKKTLRGGALSLIKKYFDYDIYKEEDLKDDAKWNALIESVAPKNEDYIKTALANFGIDILENLIPIESFNTFCWSNEAKGEILMSQNEGSTLSINGQAIKESSSGLVGSVKAAMRNATL